ncbi:MAG: TIGR00296 family protein, partial [Thermoplasmata archaeon]
MRETGEPTPRFTRWNSYARSRELELGTTAVQLAREAIETALGADPRQDASQRFIDRELDPAFDERRGVFVTLMLHPSGELRGCIGFPEPVYPLRVALPRAARAAAVEDPRFPPVEPRELAEIRVEVSILTVPEILRAVRPDARWRHVRVGVDGLIVEGHGTGGLLLPQVASAEHWTSREFLGQTCVKAGLAFHAWTDPR